MESEVNYNYGVDIGRDWSFTDGDLILSEYDDNLGQAIGNRLNTDLNELFVFYNGYGSLLKSFLGWRCTDETLRFIRLEVESCISNDPRINFFNVDVEYEGNGRIKIMVKVFVDNLNYNTFNYIISDDGAIIEEE